MNYRHIYMRIISHAKSKQSQGLRKKGNGNYYEAHHILPRSLFPNWVKRKSNIVLLTAREHFFCHQLLCKIYPSREMAYALTAFIRRPNTTLSSYKITSKEYQRLRELHSNMQKNLMKEHPEYSLGFKSKGKHWFTNGEIEVFDFKCPEGFREGRKPVSDYTRYLNSINKLGTKHSEITRARMRASGGRTTGERNSSFGKCWYTDGKVNILSKVCPEGFWKGRTLSKETLEKMKTCHKNAVAWNKGMNKASQMLYRESIKKR